MGNKRLGGLKSGLRIPALAEVQNGEAAAVLVTDGGWPPAAATAAAIELGTVCLLNRNGWLAAAAAAANAAPGKLG